MMPPRFTHTLLGILRENPSMVVLAGLRTGAGLDGRWDVVNYGEGIIPADFEPVAIVINHEGSVLFQDASQHLKGAFPEEWTKERTDVRATA